MLDLDLSAHAIAATQTEDGAIPHWPGHHADPWNHVEAAMGLDVAGLHGEAERAYAWLASVQRNDGAWAAAYMGDAITDPLFDANFCAYIATGVWHHYLSIGNADYLDRMWPCVERAIDFVLGLQTPIGYIEWARDEHYEEWPGALLTSSSCIALSLRCAIAISERVVDERPDWELSLTLLEDAIRWRENEFEDKSRYSMDWYYPVLAGVITGAAARERLRSKWDEFVIEGHGCLCVSDRPWVTTGETAELVLALDVAGLPDEAFTMFDWLQHLRADDGGYWMGVNHPDGAIWPRHKPTWATGSVLLAADALMDAGATSGLFRGETFEPSAVALD